VVQLESRIESRIHFEGTQSEVSLSPVARCQFTDLRFILVVFQRLLP